LRVPVGFVLRAHGIKGLLRVRAQGEALLCVDQLWVGERSMKLVRAQKNGDEMLIELEGVRDRVAAEALKGCSLSVEREQLPAPSENELYLSDLLGCRVVDPAGLDLGEVVSIEQHGSQDLLNIKGAHDWQLPFVEPLVRSVDLVERRIVCDPPEGLLDLNP
jgi:16S rRNA processing protein RimM